MNFSERQIGIAIALALAGIYYDEILVAIKADRREELAKKILALPSNA